MYSHLLFFLFACQPVDVQASYSIKVVDAETNEGIPYARVSYDGGVKITDKDGIIIISNPSNSLSNLEVSADYGSNNSDSGNITIANYDSINYKKSQENLHNLKPREINQIKLVKDSNSSFKFSPNSINMGNKTIKKSTDQPSNLAEKTLIYLI